MLLVIIKDHQYQILKTEKKLLKLTKKPKKYLEIDKKFKNSKKTILKLTKKSKNSLVIDKKNLEIPRNQAKNFKNPSKRSN